MNTFTTVALLRRLAHLRLRLDAGLLTQTRYDTLCQHVEFDAAEAGLDQHNAVLETLALEAAPWLRVTS